jgi:branched-chain amino acid transport system substrate-binding protein
VIFREGRTTRAQSGRRLGRLGLALLAMSGTTTAAAVLGGIGQAGAATSEPPYTIVMITSLTGEGSSEFANTPPGFNARIALQNAEGGVHGHKLDTIILDDQTSPTEIVTAVQDAMSKNPIGIISISPLFFLAAKYPNQAGIPVVGGFFDGPEWGTPPYESNMYASDVGSLNPKYPVNTAIGTFMKSHGGTVLCSYGYGISPSSTRSAIGTADSFQHAGGTTGVLDTSLPFGTVDMTTPALVAKQKGCNAFYAGLDDNSNFALATALRQDGVKPKVVVFPTGYEPDVVHGPAWADLQGGYFETEFRPFALPNAGTMQMQSALEKYEHFSSSEFPTFNQYEAWLAAGLMIQGLENAGTTATHASLNHALRSITNWNGNGLLPENIDYATDFGKDLPKTCGWYLIAEKNGFVPASSSTYCGTDLPGTTTVSG